MKNLYLFTVFLLVGCQSNSLVVENCNNAYHKTENALEELQQIKTFVVRCSQNGQTNISSEQMMKQIMPKATNAATLLADAVQYLNECITQDENLFKLRQIIQSLTACEDRIRNIYTLCDNNYLMSISGYNSEIQLIATSLDNMANDVINEALSINKFMKQYGKE